MNLQPLLREISAQYRLPPDGPHGLAHWGRVLENGLKLSQATGADTAVITLFSIFHDACRHNDSIDPHHGQRGAQLSEALLRGSSLLDENQLDQLKQACELHTAGYTRSHITIQTCWDADRLDLARVGITPLPERLCTDASKDPDLIRWASDRARRRYVPDFVSNDWGKWFDGSS